MKGNSTNRRCLARFGDTPSNPGEGHRQGCTLVVGVLSEANNRDVLKQYPHTHIINSITDSASLINALQPA